MSKQFEHEFYPQSTKNLCKDVNTFVLCINVWTAPLHSSPSAFTMCIEVCEDCISLYATEITNADRLTIISIKDVLIHSSLSLNRCCGQCYDGAANMSGKRSGVATQI